MTVTDSEIKNQKVLEYYSMLMQALKASDYNPELQAREDVKQHYLNMCLFCAIFLGDLSKVEETIHYGADVNCDYRDYQHWFLPLGITADLTYNTTSVTQRLS